MLPVYGTVMLRQSIATPYIYFYWLKQCYCIDGIRGIFSIANSTGRRQEHCGPNYGQFEYEWSPGNSPGMHCTSGRPERGGQEAKAEGKGWAEECVADLIFFVLFQLTVSQTYCSLNFDWFNAPWKILLK